MELCVKRVEFDEGRKRGLRIILAIFSFSFVIGTAHELPEVDFSKTNSACEPRSETDAQGAEIVPAETIQLKGTEERMQKEVMHIKVPLSGLKAGISRSGERVLPTVASPSVENISETVSDIFPGNMIPQIPPANSGAAAPNVSEKPVDEKPSTVPAGQDIPTVPIKQGDSSTAPAPEKEGLPAVNNPVTESPETVDPGNAEESGGEETEPEESGNGEAPVDQYGGFLVNEEGMIYSYDPGAGMLNEDGILELPGEECTGILAGTFAGVGAGICELHIPANMTFIEAGALKDLTELADIEVSTDNPAYVSSEGVLLDRSMTSILAFPADRVGIYRVPGSVTGLAEYSFAGSKLSVLNVVECGIVGIAENALEGSALTICVPREYVEEYRIMFPEKEIAGR